MNNGHVNFKRVMKNTFTRVLIVQRKRLLILNKQYKKEQCENNNYKLF